MISSILLVLALNSTPETLTVQIIQAYSSVESCNKVVDAFIKEEKAHPDGEPIGQRLRCVTMLYKEPEEPKKEEVVCKSREVLGSEVACNKES